MLGGVLGPLCHSATQLMVSLNLCSFASNLHGKDEGAVSAQKALQGSQTRRRDILEGTKEDNIFPDDKKLILYPADPLNLSFLATSLGYLVMSG